MGYIPGKSGGKGAIDNRGKGDAKMRREEESRVREEPSIQRARESERVALRNRLGQKPWVLREFGTGKPFPEEAISVHLKTLGMTDFSTRPLTLPRDYFWTGISARPICVPRACLQLEGGKCLGNQRPTIHRHLNHRWAITQVPLTIRDCDYRQNDAVNGSVDCLFVLSNRGYWIPFSVESYDTVQCIGGNKSWWKTLWDSRAGACFRHTLSTPQDCGTRVYLELDECSNDTSWFVKRRAEVISTSATMAAPPGNDPRTYSPSKLSELPDTYLTPSNNSLNNSGAYAPAVFGPIIASGHGPPARRDGQAYWNDAAPTPQPILVSSTSPSPVAGRSPQDSVMGSPESKEPTIPAVLTTQVGQNTQDAIMAALPTAPTDSQQLWDNVPSLLSDLPPQLETIEIKGHTTPHTNRTPRPRSRALSNASVWSHATVESNVSDEAEPSIPVTASLSNLTFKWHTLGAAIQARLLPDPMDLNAVPMSTYDPDGDEDEFLADLNQTLESEISQDVSAALQGWSTYKLLHPMELRKGHELPTTAKEFNCMVSAVLTALDAGATSHDGETMVKGLTPQSWMCLTLVTISAILRGALRSPSAIRSGSRSLNGIDSFPLHQDLDRPLTEGGAIMLMCQQLGGIFSSLHNHPDKTYPDSYFDRLTTLLDSRMHQVPTVTGQPPLKEEDQAQISAATHERLVLQGIETMRLDLEAMCEIKEAVKAEIYANLNAEALQNADDWRVLYKHEFVEAMHDAFEAQYPGIHPNKGKARANPPITNSQVVRKAQPRIQEEVHIQVEARVADIHQEIKASIANQEPFWGEGPLRQAIAQEIRTKTQHNMQQELEVEIQALRTNSASELNAFKLQLQWEQDKAHEALHAEAKAEYEAAKQLFANNLEADIQEFKTVIGKNVKEWKDGFRTSRNLSVLKREARRFGFSIVPTDEGSTAAEKAIFKRYSLPPIEVDGRDVSAEPADAPSPAQTPFLTPDNLPNALPDPNVTPMPVRVKHMHTEEPAVYPPLKESLFLPVSSPTPTPHAVAVPLPMDKDLDYALECPTAGVRSRRAV
ncbi:hypothetical protein EDB86DRAFT_3167203 [Lactarius hatsudake]|nr:hypothetical protein EDB86DRAFT_3167203 [Lactarius hatsudake]